MVDEDERASADTLAADAAVATSKSATSGAATMLAGRYEILGLLGAGGMGTVYKVRDRVLDEVVALKTLRREWIDAPGALERFRREVKLARRVTHKNVARTFDLTETADEKFLTMEHIDGRSLARAIDDDGAMPLAETIRVAIAIADALEAAHEAGVIHRDLKPDNVLLARDGRVVVTDFGIARAQSTAEGEGATGVGGIVGTPAYMAPEQVEGTAVGPRTDLYSLGLVVSEMITSARVWTGESALAVAAARLVRPAPRLVRSDVPEPLVQLVASMLSRRPEDRPASARDVRAALAAIVPAAPAAVAARAPDLPSVTRSIALMTIKSLDEKDTWIAESVAEDLSDALCMVRALRVRTRVAPTPGEDARAFGRRLGVDLVVDGSARRTGDGVRISVRLSSTDDGFQIWAGRHDGAIGDLILLAERASRDIAAAVGAEGMPASSARAAIDPRALELHAKARRLVSASVLDKTGGWPEIEEALRLAPAEPRILASFAMHAVRETFRGGSDVPGLLARARDAAERAIVVAPELPEPWVALAQVRMASGDTVAAARAIRRGLREGPSVPEAHEIAGRILAETGRLEEARVLVARALWLDDRLNLAHVDLARILALLGRRDEAMAQLDRLGAVNPIQRSVLLLRFTRWWPESDLPEPTAPVEGSSFAAHMFQAYGRLRREGTMSAGDRAVLEQMRSATMPGSRPRRFFSQQIAELNATVGAYDEAIAAIELAVADGLEDAAWLDRCPLFAPLRGTPRFEATASVVYARRDAILAAWDET